MNYLATIKHRLLSLSKTKTMEVTSDNPYLNARRSWNAHVAGLMSAVQVWQVVGLTSLLIGLSSVGGMIYIGSQSKFIPLVFQQDRGGNTLSVTRADKIADAQVDDYRAATAMFIENIRMVSADADLQRKAVWQVYALLSAHDPATRKANEYLNGKKEANPFNRAAIETVHVEIHSVLQLSKESWQVDWDETVRHRDGVMKGEMTHWRAIVNLYQNEPTTDTTNIEALRNPHFIFVRDFNWSRQH